MGPVGELDFFVIVVDIFDVGAVFPGEGQVFAVALEVVFDVAVGAHHRAHLLAGEGAPILALRLEGLFQGGVGDDQAHGAGFVAVGAADRLVDLRASSRRAWHRTRPCPSRPTARGYRSDLHE